MSRSDDDQSSVTSGAENATTKSTWVEPVVDETWTQVDQLPDADDSDYSEEEVGYLTLDLGRDLPGDILKNIDAFQLTNLNSSEPWVQVGPQILRGRHERMLGSDLLLETPSLESENDKVPFVIPTGATQARVRFESITLVRRTGIATKPHNNASTFLLPKKHNPAGTVTSGRGGRGKSRARSRGTVVGKAQAGVDAKSNMTERQSATPTGDAEIASVAENESEQNNSLRRDTASATPDVENF